MKRPRTPRPAQEAEEAASWEGPHLGLDGAPARAARLRLRSGAGTLHAWGTSTQGLRAPHLHNNCLLSSVSLRGRSSDCDPGASTVSVSRRDGHARLCTELWVSHYLQRTQLVPADPRPGSQKCYLQHKYPCLWRP